MGSEESLDITRDYMRGTGKMGWRTGMGCLLIAMERIMRVCGGKGTSMDMAR